MVITKKELKILKFIASKKSASYEQLIHRFSKYQDLENTLEQLVYNAYLEQIGGYRTNYGEPIPITQETTFCLRPNGLVLVESKQWFNAEYVLSHICIPIVLSVISTLLTIFLSRVL